MPNLLKHASFLIVIILIAISAQTPDPLNPDFSAPQQIPGMNLVWNDEFNGSGKPDPGSWSYENGFVRNQELQWYQSDNANVKGGVLLIEGKKEQIKNPNYISGSSDWKLNRQYASYTSASIHSSGKRSWKFGHFEIRARIDSSKGSWPAIWTLGISGEWPSNGEIDILEFYRINNTPSILANFAWGTQTRWTAKWDGANKPLSYFLSKDSKWVQKFHIWTMDWNKDTIRLSIDGELMNETLLNITLNADGSNPFLQPHYILLNLALGSNGGDPSSSLFPINYEVDYVRVYQKGTAVIIHPADTDNRVTISNVKSNIFSVVLSASHFSKMNLPSFFIYNLEGSLVLRGKLISDQNNSCFFKANLEKGTYCITFSDSGIRPQKILIH